MCVSKLRLDFSFITCYLQMPKGADSSWIQKLYKHHMKKEHFSKPRLSQTAFIVHHFADDVEYEMKGFVEKNRDSVNQEHLAILKASEVCKEIETWNVIKEALNF